MIENVLDKKHSCCPVLPDQLCRWWNCKRLSVGHTEAFESILQDPVWAFPERCRFHLARWNPRLFPRESFGICWADNRNCRWSAVCGSTGDNYWTILLPLVLSWSTSIFFVLWGLWGYRALYISGGPDAGGIMGLPLTDLHRNSAGLICELNWRLVFVANIDLIGRCFRTWNDRSVIHTMSESYLSILRQKTSAMVYFSNQPQGQAAAWSSTWSAFPLINPCLLS